MTVELENVSKILSNTAVLDHISMNMQGGHVYGLHGINGCGKTMLMRVVAGLIHPTEGQVLVNGKFLSGQNSFPESLGLLLENPAFLNQFTGFENLWLLAQIQSRISEEEVRDVLRRVGLDPEDKRAYRKYSLGMKQRLGIACAIMEKPDLLLLDEPFISLDDDGVKQTFQIIQEEKKRGALVILSSHDYDLLTHASDTIFHLTAGKVTKHYIKTEDGTFREVGRCEVG